MLRNLLWILLVSLALAACSKKDPGPLEGTWRMSDPFPMTVTFSRGRAEAMGMIEEVTYEIDGKDVIVTWKTGISAGTAMRYTIVSPETVSTDIGILRRVHR